MSIIFLKRWKNNENDWQHLPFPVFCRSNINDEYTLSTVQYDAYNISTVKGPVDDQIICQILRHCQIQGGF